jgi:hypothetical protein
MTPAKFISIPLLQVKKSENKTKTSSRLRNKTKIKENSLKIRKRTIPEEEDK